ncbi:PspA-associated protein PspAB [Paraconexibacter algicola]|uniref:Uncharacterized protein n=1 Tax=Paraconexibacter algicola TaxID=2133960 RepID=A0A2T4UFA7_9ACTN|nr:hypothetical protein [Paraconexibacter algicola]PTL56459.1 hypothetical protein C7Y72_15980 [Paraconexibacter algicola]
MGFFDALLGKRKVAPPAAKDRLFAMSTAHIAMDVDGLRARGRAGIVFQSLGTADFSRVVQEMEEVLHGTGEETGTTVSSQDDSFGYRWMILEDPDVEDLVVGVHAVNDALAIAGYGDRTLAAVFAYEDGSQPLYWIYNIKRGSWYPFVPAGGEQARSNERELQLKARYGGDLPIEPELERWFPLWGVPL